jgi:hypothetical protein
MGCKKHECREVFGPAESGKVLAAVVGQARQEGRGCCHGVEE